MKPISNYSSSAPLPSDHSLNQRGIRWSGDVRNERISPSKIKPTIDRSKVDPSIVKAAEGMEAMFIDHMMQVMRQTVPKQEMDLDSPAAQIYRGLLDSEYAQKAAHNGGIGLADVMIAYLESRGYNSSEGNGNPGANNKEEKP